MKQIGLIALLLAAPLAAMAQFTIFTDDFTHGSTTNKTSNPGGTPFASFTSYDIAATKAALNNCPITNGTFKIALDGTTSSGLIEAQALFTKNPITLINVGDSITLTYTFRMTNGLPGTSAYLGQGLYNSGGQPPVANGALANAGLGTAGFATGNAAGWQGILTKIFSNATSVAQTRAPQTGANSANQSLIGAGVTGGFANPGPTTLPGSTNVLTSLSLTPGAYYTINYTIALADTNAGTETLTLTNTLSDSSGTVLFVMTNVATGAAYQTSFDGLAFGRRETTASTPIVMMITNITITANLSTLPGQPFNVTGGGQGCPGNTFPVGLNGSITINDYYLYTNGVWNGVVQTGNGSPVNFPLETVISVPLTNTVFASNTVSGATGFMLGSVVVSPNPAPAITGQPIPVIVASGSIGVFNVAATGGGLTYQWYKNGTPLANLGHYSGVTTPTLVISPADNSDAANTAQGYYAIITSGCGATLPTATNSLTISAPANIVWQGGNPNTNWDLSVTTNFVNGATPVVFHNGDNVTFDDTSGVTVLSIANNFIAPTLITESAGLSYTINGPGVIQGPGALVMSGFGFFSINNSNAFTGGATINSGSLVLSNQFGVGQGTITLAGGTLEIPNAFGSAAGISNNINVTGNATLQFDKTGTFACVLDGAIMGNSSATLTINNNSGTTATSRLRLYSAFTNNANVVLNSLGSEIEFAPYLGSNDQVFNGVISGTFGHIVPRGAGNVILNNTNTFNDSNGSFNGVKGYSLFMSSGNAGIGADSVSTTPGVIDASPVGTGWLGINVGTEGGTCALFANGGAHTIGNLMAYTSATNTVTLILGGSNNLTFAGEFDLANPDNTRNAALPTDTTGTNRTIQVTNTAATIFSGLITDNGHPSGITKTGNGVLYLNGTSTNSGVTFVNGGVLAGSGSTLSAVDVQTNGLIGGGPTTGIGTFTINNSLTFDSGGAFIRINKALSPGQSNDVVSVTGALTANAGNGTIVVTNTGPAISVGDTFKIFSKAVTGTGTFNILGGGMNWNNNLAVDGSITAASISTGPTTPTNMTFSVSGTNMTFSWPLPYLGWYLQMNTNMTSNTWRTLFGTQNHTNNTVSMNPAQPQEFFRMSLQP